MRGGQPSLGAWGRSLRKAARCRCGRAGSVRPCCWQQARYEPARIFLIHHLRTAPGRQPRGALAPGNGGGFPQPRSPQGLLREARSRPEGLWQRPAARSPRPHSAGLKLSAWLGTNRTARPNGTRAGHCGDITPRLCLFCLGQGGEGPFGHSLVTKTLIS